MHFRSTAISALSSLTLSLGLIACSGSPTGVEDSHSAASLGESGVAIPDNSGADGALAELAAAEVGTLISDMGPGAPQTSFKSASGLMFESDLDTEDAACWEDRNTSGYARSACGPWGSIGSAGSKLAAGLGRNGSKALEVTFRKNEEVGGASLALSAEVVNVRAYYNFSEGYDFGQGVKIGRVSAFNDALQANDVDIILAVRSSGSVNQCGLNDMADLSLLFNGKPLGYDWGNISSRIRFERGRWYAVEYQVKLNTPGIKDGAVKLWVDGNLVASKEGMNIRGNGGSNVKLNRIRIGGWYSNGANGNSGCSNPSQASTMHVDDVAVGNDYIGTK